MLDEPSSPARLSGSPSDNGDASRPVRDASALLVPALARAHFEQSSLSMVLYDAQGYPLAVNAAFEALWGVTLDSVPREYTVLADAELERQGALSYVRRAFAGERVVTPPVRYDIAAVSASRDGRSVWTEGHFDPVRDDAGRVTHVLLTHVDLTARMAVEEALQEQTREFEAQVEEAQSLNEELEQTNEELQTTLTELEEARDDAERERGRLRHVLDALPDIAVAFDEGWRYQYFNPAAAAGMRASGREPAEMLGRVLWEVYPELRGTIFEANKLRAARERRVIEFEWYSPEQGRWFENRVVPTPGGVVRFTRDITARRRDEVADRLLASAGTLLASSLDYEATLQHVAELAVPALADWCAVDLLGEDGSLALLAVAHADPERVRWARELRRLQPPDRDAPRGTAAVARTGTAEFYPLVSDALLAEMARDEEHLRAIREVGFRSVIIAPLTARGRTLGALTLVTTSESARRFHADDVPIAEELARRAAVAIDNARLHRAERQAAQRMERLQAVTAQLATTVTAEQAADAVLHGALAALDASHGVVCLLTPDGTELEIVRAAGLGAETERSYRRFPVEAPLPLSEAVRTGECVALPNRAAIAERYPQLAAANARSASSAWIALPLRVHGRVFGGIALGFDADRAVDGDDRAFTTALAAQCAQALERARLFQAEQAARVAAEESEGRFRAAADQAPVLIWTSGVDAQCDWFNQPWLRFTGRTMAQELGDGWADGVHPDDLQHCVEIYRGAFGRREAFMMEYRLRRHDGEYRWLLGTGVPRVDANDEFVGFIGSCIDITDRKRWEAEREALLTREQAARLEAEAANRAKSDFLATMSHELRTPLNAIDGYAELLELEVRGPLSAAQREDIQRIRRSQKHLLALINDVLGFARLESGRVEFDVRPVPLQRVFGELEELIAPQLRSKAIEFTCDPVEPTVEVLADPDKLRQVMLNLLSNAVKFTDEGGITVSCEVRPHDIAITVADTGRGIPADMLEAVFEPFVQVDHGLTRSSTGSGLGLAISRDLVRRMEGELRVESELGDGSRFILTLPRPDQGARAPG